jgi:hypothetical protein
MYSYSSWKKIHALLRAHTSLFRDCLTVCLNKTKIKGSICLLGCPLHIILEICLSGYTVTREPSLSCFKVSFIFCTIDKTWDKLFQYFNKKELFKASGFVFSKDKLSDLKRNYRRVLKGGNLPRPQSLSEQ